jgi:hypothetical protein
MINTMVLKDTPTGVVATFTRRHDHECGEPSNGALSDLVMQAVAGFLGQNCRAAKGHPILSIEVRTE